MINRISRKLLFIGSKLCKSLSMYLTLTLIALTVMSTSFAFAATNDSQGVKRIISVVYDDSFSMVSSNDNPKKQDDKYAKYALENIIGFMNDNDVLSIVKMSQKNKYQEYKVNGKGEKISSIQTVDIWESKGLETPFEAVETAIDYLKGSKELNGKNDGIEYWLLVLTDGDFTGRPKNVEEYFNNVRVNMSDVKYESVWVFIGKDVNKSFSNSLQNVPGTSVLFSDNNEKICDAVYDACSIIYGRPTIKQSNFVATNGNKTITINSSFPVNKLMVYEQDQDASLVSIEVNGKSYTKFESIEVTKVEEPSIKSKITENDSSDTLPAGDITLNFANPVNTSENKFMVMLDYALELQLGAIDSEGKFEMLPTSNYKDGDNASFVAKVINLYDGKEVDLTTYRNGLTSTYAYDGKTNNMSFDGSDKCFKFMSPVKVGSNAFSSVLSLSGQFRLKSNIVDIYVPSGPSPIYAKISGEDITVSKKLGDYEKVGTKEISFTGFDSEEKIKLEFVNIPKGIQIKANGSGIKKDKVELKVRGRQKLNLDVYRNKDYGSESTNTVEVKLDFVNQEINDLLQTHNLSFDIAPSIRVLRLNSSTAKGIDLDALNSDNAFDKNIFQIIPTVDGKNMDMEELKKSKITFKTNPSKIKSKIGYKLEEIDGQNGIYVYFKPTLNWFTRGEEFILDVDMKTAFGEEIHSTGHNIKIKNNIIGAIIKTVVLLFVLWFIVGLIKKPRFDKQAYKIIVAENGREKANEIIRSNGGIGNLIPYKPQEGYAYDLNVKAGENKNYIVVDKGSLREEMKYENVAVDTTKDLKLYADIPLIVTSGRSRTLYVYTTAETADEFIGKIDGGRETRSERGSGLRRETRGERGSGFGRGTRSEGLARTDRSHRGFSSGRRRFSSDDEG